MSAQRQGTETRVSCGEYGIGQGGQNGDWTDFASAAKWTGAAINQVDLDRGHFRHTENWIVVPVALYGAAAIKSDFRFESYSEPPCDSALERVRRDVRIENCAGIGNADDFVNFHLAVLRDGKFNDMSDVCLERLGVGDSAIVALWRGSVPVGLVRGKVEDGE